MYQGVSTSFFKKRNNRGNSFVVNNSTKDDISLIYDVQEWSINCQGVVRGLIRKIVSHSLFLTESRNNFRNIFFSHWFPREQEIRLPNNRQKTHLLQSEAFEKATKTTKKKEGTKRNETNGNERSMSEQHSTTQETWDGATHRHRLRYRTSSTRLSAFSDGRVSNLMVEYTH